MTSGIRACFASIGRAICNDGYGNIRTPTQVCKDTLTHHAEHLADAAKWGAKFATVIVSGKNNAAVSGGDTCANNSAGIPTYAATIGSFALSVGIDTFKAWRDGDHHQRSGWTTFRAALGWGLVEAGTHLTVTGAGPLIYNAMGLVPDDCPDGLSSVWHQAMIGVGVTSVVIGHFIRPTPHHDPASQGYSRLESVA